MVEVHVVINGISLDARKVYFSRGEIERHLSKSEAFNLDGNIQVESLMELIERYFQFRGLTMPEDEFHALAFMTSKLGE